jgi:hypothetical protein
MGRASLMRRALLTTAPVVVLVAVTADAKPTNPKIVLGQSIGDIKVGMTRARVERILGPGQVIGHKGVRIEDWPKLGLGVFFKGGKLSAKTIGAETNNPAYYTPQGIRFGSATKAVTGAYGTANCVSADNPTPENPYKECTRHGPAGRVTIFYFDPAGEVDRIALGADSIASLP